MAYALPQRFVLDQAVEGRAQGDSIAFAFAVAVAVAVAVAAAIAVDYYYA